MSLIQSTSNGHYLTFDDDKHRYILDGERVPGVTTFGHGGYPTSEALISWMKGQTGNAVFDALLSQQGGGYYPHVVFPISETERKEIVKKAKTADRTKSEEAADIGTLVHDFCYQTEVNKVVSKELLDKIGLHKDKEKILAGVDKFTEWRKTNADEMVASESIIASPTHSFGGKFDRLARRDGKLILSDFKTSGAIYVDQFIQLAAYRIAIQEWLGMTVEGLEVLRFGKDDGEFETKMIDKPEEIKAFEEQAIRCRYTYIFRNKWESDKRFKWGGSK